MNTDQVSKKSDSNVLKRINQFLWEHFFYYLLSGLYYIILMSIALVITTTIMLLLLITAIITFPFRPKTYDPNDTILNLLKSPIEAWKGWVEMMSMLHHESCLKCGYKKEGNYCSCGCNLNALYGDQLKD